jgi:hypothetical protein
MEGELPLVLSCSTWLSYLRRNVVHQGETEGALEVSLKGFVDVTYCLQADGG